MIRIVAVVLILAGYLPGIAHSKSQTDQVVSAEKILAQLRANDSPIEYSDVVIHGDLDLTLLPENNENEVRIGVPVWITNSRFDGEIITAGPNSQIPIYFDGGVDFIGTTFQENADFSNAHFEETASFLESRFQKIAFFTNSSFPDGTSFQQAYFNGETDFTLAQFQGGVDFSGATFQEESIFSSSQWNGSTLFIGTIFKKNVCFLDTYFSDSVMFDYAEFLSTEKTANFDNSEFEAEASFRTARIESNISFKEASFGIVDFTDTQFSRQLDLTETAYDALKISGDGSYQLIDAATVQNQGKDTQDMLIRLENNFRAQKQLDLANAALYRRNVLARESKPYFEQLFEILLIDWPFGYGVYPWRTIAVSALLILLFAWFYFPQGVIRETPTAPPKPREYRLGFRLTELPLARKGEFPELETQSQKTNGPFLKLWRLLNSERARRFGIALGFSFSVFTKISFGNRVAVKATGLVIAEWFLGLVMLAGFFYTLSNTIPLLQALLKSVF